jgi:hypothetical protein
MCWDGAITPKILDILLECRWPNLHLLDLRALHLGRIDARLIPCILAFLSAHPLENVLLPSQDSIHQIPGLELCVPHLKHAHNKLLSRLANRTAGNHLIESARVEIVGGVTVHGPDGEFAMEAPSASDISLLKAFVNLRRLTFFMVAPFPWTKKSAQRVGDDCRKGLAAIFDSAPNLEDLTMQITRWESRPGDAEYIIQGLIVRVLLSVVLILLTVASV